MTLLLWLSGAVAAGTIWAYQRRLLRGDDLGSVSPQWLHSYRSEAHQNE